MKVFVELELPPVRGNRLERHDALLLVDLQNDFLPGGALAVPESGHMIAAANAWISLFAAKRLAVVASRDWHPRDHCSFVQQGGPWPAHCIAETAGARFPEDLRLPSAALIVDKGSVPTRDAYSAFDGTSLYASLTELGVQRLFIGGLATDYCVLRTVLDALACGFQVILLTDLLAAVNVHAEDGAKAMETMQMRGVVPAGLREFLR
jgi:nicotinamidase/pyrazinamidase